MTDLRAHRGGERRERKKAVEMDGFGLGVGDVRGSSEGQSGAEEPRNCDNFGA